MQWLISNAEPEAVNALILDDELLQDGIMREIMDHLPWYKRTRHMDAILAGHLIHIIRSGFERSFVLRQMESLDIPMEVAERFLQILEVRGRCRFGEPRYFYAPVQFVSPLGKGVAVQSSYGKRTIISEPLAECLQLLPRPMPREKYQEVLTEYLGRKQHAEQACQTLARQGLLLSCDSTQTPVRDYGVLRWTLELESHGDLLSQAAWEERLNFLEESFQSSYFHSRNHYVTTPIGLCGNLDTITAVGDAAYFVDLSFKLQRFAQQIPISLRAANLSAYYSYQELRVQSPTLFEWGLTLDVRHTGDALIEELLGFVKRREFSHVIEVRLLLGREWPASLGLLNEYVRLKLYSTGDLELPPLETMPAALRYVVEQYLRPRCQREGCGAGLSLYIDGQGYVSSCSLEGGIPLGHIADGQRAIEHNRRSLRYSRTAACRFGVNPDSGRESDLNRVGPVLLTPESSTRPQREFTCA
jgi:hypothetical protein